jgi:hypothetical protein
MGDLAQRQDHFDVGQCLQFRFQELAAGLDFRRFRLVLRRHATHRIGDTAIDQFQTVVDALVIGALRQPVLEQGGVKQVAGPVAREGTTRPVGALQSGRQAGDQDAGGQRTEAGNGSVEPVRIFDPVGFSEC